YTSHGVRLGVALDNVDTGHNQAVVSQDLEDLAALAFVFTGDDDDVVVTFDLLHDRAPYSTSGARETIFMNCSLRSSRVTGQKMLVLIGSFWMLSRTAALPSQAISEPSVRRTP